VTDDASPCWACSQCGNLQASGTACARCRYDVLLDVRRESVRELLHENDQRMQDKYRDRFRMVGVAGGMIIVVAIWFIPHFWEVRRHAFALPFLADQILLMVAIALGLLKLLETRIPRTKYPWLDGLPPATAR
jgi:Na+/H+ antiporter NhaA